MMPAPGRPSRESRAQTGGIGAARLRHVRPAATLTAHARGYLIDQLAGMQASREILGHAGNQRDLVVYHGSQDDSRRRQFVLQLVQGLAQTLLVHTLELGG